MPTTDPHDSRDVYTRADELARRNGWTETRQPEGSGLRVTWVRGARSIDVLFDADRDPVSMFGISATGRLNFYYGIAPVLFSWLRRG